MAGLTIAAGAFWREARIARDNQQQARAREAEAWVESGRAAMRNPVEARAKLRSALRLSRTLVVISPSHASGIRWRHQRGLLWAILGLVTLIDER